ncbi:MCE family protein [Saccharomonospora iraqiensis]|uniref:MCE family protein n=1 Tax=Saccharomonospora iraqiensis TaxID=52698 RepID=UPI000411D538|nr:MCE family protein [Saccharomonospora iraqiensis]
MRTIAAPLTKALVFILVTTVATAVLALSITNTAVSDRTHYSARFTDATSVAEGDDVRIAGVRVGQVEELEIVDRHLALVHFSVRKSRDLPADVTATLRYRNMIGQRYLALERGEEPSTETLPPGAEIPMERTTPALDMTELFNGFRPLFEALAPEDVNRLSGEIIQVLQGESGTVESLLEHTGSLTRTIADRDRVIGEVITNLNSVLDTVNNEGDALSNLVTTVRQLVSGLAEDRAVIGESIEGLSALTTSTAGLFTDARAPLKDSIAGLREVSGHLAAGSGELEQFLTTTPRKLTELGRVASYGSWMNFYLCEGLLLTDPPTGTRPDPVPARCTP